MIIPLRALPTRINSLRRRRSRAPFAYAASAATHVVLLGLLATWKANETEWRFQVQAGSAIVLSASLVSAAPEPPSPLWATFESESPPQHVREAPLASPRDVSLPEAATPTTPPPTLETPTPDGETPLRDRAIPTLPELTRSTEEPAMPADSNAASSLPRSDSRHREAPVAELVEAEVPRPSSTPVLDAGAKVDSPPSPLPQNPAPDYPLEARRAGWQGRVLLLVAVSEEGRVERVEVRASSGYRVLDDAALRAVRRWRFSAARRGAQLVAAEVLVPVRFSLRP